MMDRIERLREATAELGADVSIVSHPANRFYFSGFPAEDHAPDELAALIVVAADSAVLYTSPTNLPWAAASVGSSVEALPWERPWQQFIGRQLRDSGASRAAFEDRALTVADHAALATAADGIAFVPVGTAFSALRAIKDEDELARIGAAARITDAAFVAATDGLEAGITEKQLAWRIDSIMRDLGADGAAFATCVAAGPHGARPHHDPSDRPLAEDEPIVIDMGAVVGGYRADLTRTILLGEAPPEYTERYTIVLEAQLAALSATRPGMTGKDADAIARDSLAAAGFAREFIHGLGHGVGLLIHEYPSLGAKSDDVLQPGHVVTIEPGMYLEGWGGIRIEDLCVVTRDGLQVLSNAPK